jgi:hypothetical protein
MTVPLCADCAHCTIPAANPVTNPSPNINHGLCYAVVDPFSGAPFAVKVARLDKHPEMGWVLPCQYAGNLFKAKS